MTDDAPKFKSLRELLSEPSPPTRYRIREWQPIGTRVLVAAQFKAGKTSLVNNTVRSLIDGDPFLGAFDVVPINGTVAMFDLEMSLPMFKTWMQAQQIRNDDRVWPVLLRGRLSEFPLLDRKRRGALAQRLRDQQTEYVVWDCVRPLIDACGLDENKDAGRLLTAFDALLEEAGVKDALVVQHMGHSGERARGDSRFRDWPDVEWRLVRQDENPHSPRFISAYGRDVDRPEAQLFYDKETRRLTIADGSRRDLHLDGLVDDVLAALGDQELSGRDLDKLRAEPVSRRDWQAAITRAVTAGLIVTREGPKRAILHSAPVRRSAPVVNQHTGGPSAPVPQCVYTHGHGAHEPDPVFDPLNAFGEGQR